MGDYGLREASVRTQEGVQLTTFLILLLPPVRPKEAEVKNGYVYCLTVLEGLIGGNELLNPEDEETTLTRGLVRVHSLCCCSRLGRSKSWEIEVIVHRGWGRRGTRSSKRVSNEKTQAEGDTAVGAIRVLSVVQ